MYSPKVPALVGALSSRLALFLCSLALLAGATGTLRAQTPDSEEWQMLTLINNYRAQHGLGPLQASASLTNAAEWMSNDMASKNYFSHTDSLGRDAFMRMAAFGYNYNTPRAENIAGGNSTAAATFDQWKNSAEHNANMLGGSYKVIGIGRAYNANSTSGWYWTADFGGFVDQVITQTKKPVDDFDGDGKTDVAVFHPSNGYWYTINPNNGVAQSVQWGVSGDVPVPGDYDGDGKTDIAVFHPSNGNWYILNPSTGVARTVQWGVSGDVPAPADYDGDGKTDIAVFHPSNGNWYILNLSTGVARTVQWGVSGDKPVPADYDGDGKADVAVFHPSNGNWYSLNLDTGVARTVQWGVSGDVPVPGDYDGDGRADVAVFHPSNSIWYVLKSSDGNWLQTQWGVSGDVPVPGDYDGDGKTDLAVFRPSNGNWYILNSTNSNLLLIQWGVNGDIPLPPTH